MALGKRDASTHLRLLCCAPSPTRRTQSDRAGVAPGRQGIAKSPASYLPPHTRPSPWASMWKRTPRAKARWLRPVRIRACVHAWSQSASCMGQLGSQFWLARILSAGGKHLVEQVAQRARGASRMRAQTVVSLLVQRRPHAFPRHLLSVAHILVTLSCSSRRSFPLPYRTCPHVPTLPAPSLSAVRRGSGMAANKGNAYDDR
jgi:hypothetical protein